MDRSGTGAFIVEITPPKFPKVDRRLIGTWKSDAKRTIAGWTWTKKPSTKNLKTFNSIFGRWEMIFDRSKVISQLPDGKWEYSRRYQVLGTDERSVVIVIYGKPAVKDPQKYPDLGI